MKLIFRILVLCVLFAWSQEGFGQAVGRGKITAAEFFFDTDPGPGNGVACSLQGNTNEVLRNAIQTASAGLSVGLHSLQLRFKDSLNNWSPLYKTSFSVESVLSSRSISIALGRAYWNNNPGTAVPLVIFNGQLSNTLNQFILSANLSSFSSASLNTLYVEVMGADGNYSPPFKTVISYESLLSPNRILAASLAKAYWDSNASQFTGLIILNGNAGSVINSFITSTPLSTFSGFGQHTLHVQMLDPNGNNNVSPTFTTTVTFDTLLQVARAIRVDAGRAWIDNAMPAQPNMIAFDGNFNQAIETALHSFGAQPTGMHTLKVQLRDSITSNWSPIFTTAISVEGPLPYRNINVASGQLYWDNDTNNLVQPLLAFDGNFSDAVESALQSNCPIPASGMHTLCVRFKDVANNWSAPFKVAMSIEDPISARNVQVTQAEVQLDQNPPLTVVGMVSNFNQTLETAQATLLSTGVPNGLHTLRVRMKGTGSQWGPFFTSALEITPCASSPNPLVTVGGVLTFCHGDSVQLSAPSGYGSYNWVVNNQLVGTGQTVQARDSGEYVLIVTDTANCAGASAPVLVTVHKPTPLIVSHPLCSGGTDSLMVQQGFASYAWNGVPGQFKRYINSIGTYTVIVTDGFGCTGSSVATITSIPSPPIPIISLNGSASFCAGTTLTLTSSMASNIQWNTGSTQQSITTDSSGYYTVTVTGSNGCQSTSAPVTTTKFGSGAALVTANGPLVFCSGESRVLTAASAQSYTWSTGDTTQSIVVTTSGTYSVVVQDGNGCSAPSTPLNIVVNPTPVIPVVTANGPLDFCNGSQVILTSSAASQNFWSTGATSQSITVYESGIITDTIINSFGCKSGSLPVVISVHPTASIAANGPTTFCAGGQVQLTASPGTGVSYAWSNGSTSSSITISSSQNLSVIVTETGFGCTDTAHVNVVVHPLPIGSITALGNTTICYNQSVTLQSNNAPHCRYQWFKNGAPITFTVYNIFCSCYQTYNVYGNNYVAGETGVYMALAIDTLTGCTSFTNSVAVTSILPALPIITANGGSTLCIGANTVLSATSASGYLWNTGATTQSIVASSPGNYQVTITDSYGCTRSSDPTTVTFYQPAQIQSSGPTTFCQGSSVNLSASPLGTYLWSNGSTSSTVNNITTTGNYSVQVTDTNGCVTQSTMVPIVVNPLPAGSITALGNTTFCEGQSVTLSGATSPNAIYKWYRNGVPIFYLSYNIYCSCYVPIYTYGYNFAATVSGNYSAEVIDTLTGCSSFTNAIAVVVNSLPTAVITQTQFIACNGQATAALQATASGTIPPYSYSWSNNATTAFIQNIPAGVFTVEVTDGNGCQFDTSYQVMQPALIGGIAQGHANAQGYHITCPGTATGSATVYPNGGTPPYSFLWSTGATTPTVSGLLAGTYTVQINDANGCSSYSTTAEIIEPAGMNINLQPFLYYGGHAIRCAGDSNGMVTPIITGGTGPYTFLWSNGAISSTVNNLTVGTHQVTVTDSVGCTATASIALTEPSALNQLATLSDYAGYGITCIGATDGYVDLMVGGGTAPYTVWWTDTSSLFQRTNLGSGNYYFHVQDTLGCEIYDSLTLTEPELAIVITTGSVLNCYGDQTGTVVAQATSLHAPFTYSWNQGAQTDSVANLSAGSYTVIVTDSRGCSVTSSATVTQPDQFIAYAFGTYIGCGSQIGLLSASASGGNPPYTYLWNNGSTQNFMNNQPLGTYYVTIMDSHGCLDSAEAVIVSPPSLQATVTNYSTSCDSITTVPAAHISVSASGGVLPYMYLWSNGSTQDSLDNLTTGYYTVIVTDANGCTTSGISLATNNDDAVIGGDTVLCIGGNGGVIGTIPGSSFLWKRYGIPVGTTDSITITDPGIYTVDMVNLNGCAHTDTALVIETNCQSVLNLTVYLEGFYVGNGTMQPALYNQGVGADPLITDSILVELHEPFYPYALLDSRWTELHTNGSAVVNFPPMDDTLYVVVKHRNHLETWSAYPQIIHQGSNAIPLHSSANKAFGNNLKSMSAGVWAIFAGDINQDATVDAFDYLLLDPDIISGNFGYLVTDLTGDGIADAFDYIVLDSNLINGVGVMAP
jgi:hypothetical protein